jgi:oxygen-independent coproporphyrinogen-3 oxidase
MKEPVQNLADRSPKALPILSSSQPPAQTRDQTTAGNYFVSNYPPYSFWSPERTGEAEAALARRPAADAPLGLYLHIPFCRKRCHFCYFKIYTGKTASEVDSYLDGVLAELRLYASRPLLSGRKPLFIYFGGGTPSFLSTRQLSRLARGMQETMSWDEAREITFECEPGTLTEGKLRVTRDLGVTRLSLGIEHFDDELLQINGRAHGSREIYRAYEFARSIGFPQINVDLIAGMVGETPAKWRESVEKTIRLRPDSVTIYQMEVPYNTTLYREMKAAGRTAAPVADWTEKRGWVDWAFGEFEQAGYQVGSAYTVVDDAARTRFLYRDMLWAGADLLGLGVASFSHAGGTHFQNEGDFAAYLHTVGAGKLPIHRALTPSPRERMVREFILQMKLGRVPFSYFTRKFGLDPREEFAGPLRELAAQGFLSVENGELRLTRSGLLQVDRLLPHFYLPEHRNARYA